MEENEDKLSQAVNNATKAAGNKVKDTGKKAAKKALKESFKLALKAVRNAILFFLSHPILLLTIIIIIILIAAFVKILKMDDADNLTAYGKTSINGVLGLTDISELVTINGSPEKGYSLAFVDNIDEKLEKVIESDDQYEALDINEDTLKQYIKAELVTQLPYLGEGVKASELPDLEGVDILYEPEETVGQVNSIDGFLMLGDSFTVGLQSTGMLSECVFRCKSGETPKYWNDNFGEMPDNANGVCVLLGVNNPGQTKEMKELIDKLCEKYEGKPIYVQKVFPLGKNYTGAATQSAIDKYNDEIQKYCSEKENVYWIDTTQGYVDDLGYLITSDSTGLHPDDYKTLVSNIKNQIVAGRGTSTELGDGELQGNSPKEAIWNYLISKGFSEVVASGIMGNWFEESTLLSNAVQGCFNQSNPTQYNEDYTRQVNTGVISEYEFVNNGPNGGGYGLAQWTYPSRKQGLYDFAKSQEADIDDLKMQLDYFIYELEKNYQSLLEDSFMKMNSIDSIENAAVTFHNVYESSSDTAEQIKERVTAAETIYDELHGTIPSGVYSTSVAKKAMAVTDREVDKENTFQGLIKLKRVIPDKDIGKLKEVDGKVIELTYVPLGVFNAYLNEQNKNVLKVFSINNNREIVFAKWSYNEGTLRYEKASSVNIATVMEKYTMPYDYLMMLNVYGEDVEFCLGLAELALESEYIIAIQDQVSTTYTKTEQLETIYDEENDETITNYYGPYEKISETDSQKIELTYADSWAILLENEVTYKDEDKAKRKDMPATSTGPTSTTEGNVTTTVTTSTIVNKYESGETTVKKEEGGKKFVELYNKCDKFRLTEPSWLFEGLNSNAKTTKLVDLTKYLLYISTKEYYGVKEPEEVFSQYEENEFKQVKKQNKGTIGLAFIKAWENNDLRKFMEGDETVSYDSSVSIYSCVTENKEKYILHDEIGQGKGNKIYGAEVKSYDQENGYGWQNVDLFKEQGINIKESEYNVYGESQIDVEIIDQIAINSWNKQKEKVEEIANVYEIELEKHQVDCMIDILYDKGNIHKILKAYARYGEDEEKLKEAFEEFKGQRGNARWILFTEGRYCTPVEGEELDPSNYSGGGDFYELAYELHEYLRTNGYWYPSAANLAAGAYVSDGASIQHKLPVEGEAPSSRYVDCSAYVSWVISKYTEEDKIWGSGELISNPMNFEVIATSTSGYTEEDLQPGDILVIHNGSSQHTEIYAGDGKTLNCGSTNAIRREFSNYVPNKFTHVFRAPN